MHLTNVFQALALATTALAFGNLHSATDGLLQIHPSFAGDKITLFPALHPDHDKNDLSHIVPGYSRELYYSQEGHRPAMHGAKHADYKANYTLPAVVLEHSNHIKSVQCRDRSILICFQTEKAFETVRSWENLEAFHLITYHVGCGDESSGKRSYFNASQPVLIPSSRCVRVSTQPVEHKDVVESGEVSWGTYISPTEQRRADTKGHVRMIHSSSSADNGQPPGPATVNLDTNVAAFKYFFNETRSNVTLSNATVNYIDFAPTNGTLSRRGYRVRRGNPDVIVVSDGGAQPEKTLWDKFVSFCNDAVDWFKSIPGKVKKVFEVLGTLTKLGWDLAQVPFGVPFERTYNEDFRINETLTGTASTKAPQIFGHENGHKLGPDGKHGTATAETTIQCTKCGVSANFNVNGKLAFSRDEGITAGRASFHNLDPILVDAIFGITIKSQYSKAWQKKIPIKKQPTPIDIPGLITIGPMINVNAAFTVTLDGDAELLVGGSFSMATGSAHVDLVNQTRTGYSGFEQKFTPTFEFKGGSVSATGELGLPVTVEAGIDLLDGTWKKTAGVTASPAVYVKSTYTTKKKESCSNGVELRAGVKSPVVFSVLDLYKTDEFLADPLYEHGLACFTKDGNHPERVGPASGIIADVIKKFKGEDISKNVPPLEDATAGFPKTTSKGNAGFRILLTAEQDGIVVSGTDGNIYVVASKADYDFSSPWATTDKSQGVLTMDTFGRLIAFQAKRFTQKYPINISVLDLFVAPETAMPQGSMAAGIAELEDQSQQAKVGLYSVVVNNPVPSAFAGMKKLLYVPTVCMGTNGLRLLGTQYVITDKKDKDGNFVVEDPVGYSKIARTKRTPHQWLEAGLDNLGYDLNNCRTIQLIPGSG